MDKTVNDNLGYTQSSLRNVNHLDSGLPKWVITAAFVIMVLAAI